ncbi:MAG TPA: ComEC/Rec2 family competence protein [Thermoanaerobaculaceae bacterium]|nr:ComEC/Rec2 family competence protein [Thermoanaerobaculaceae bacterium]
MSRSWLRSLAPPADLPGSRLVALGASAIAAMAVGNLAPPSPVWTWPLAAAAAAAACCGLRTPSRRLGWWGACGLLLGFAACARAPRAPEGLGARALPVRFEVVVRDGWSRGERGWSTRAAVRRLESGSGPVAHPAELQMSIPADLASSRLPMPGTGWTGSGELRFDPDAPLRPPALHVKTMLLLAPAPAGSPVDRGREVVVRALQRAADVDPVRLRAAGLAAAVLLGRRDALLEGEVASLRRSGLAHLLAVAGLHAGAFGLLVWGALRLACFPLAARRWALAGSLAAFALIAGGNTPVRRAVVAAIVYLLARQLGRPLPAVPTVWAVVASLAALEPEMVLQPGFQLTAAVSLALVRWVVPLAARLPLPAKVGQALAVAVVAQAASAPIVGEHFASVPPLGAAANLTAAPFALVLIALSLAAVLALPISTGLAGLALGGVAAARAALDLVSGVGGLGAQPFAPLPVAVAVGLAGVGALALTRTRVAAPAAWLAASATAVWLVLPAPARALPNEVRMLGVRDGMALLVRQGRAAILVDAGRSPVEAWRELARLRVDRLDAVFLTHPDVDHTGGAAMLLDRLQVARLAYPRALAGRGEIAVLRRLARRRGIPELPLERGSLVRIEGVAWDVAWPPRELEGADNDASLVARVDVGGVRLLVTGDLEARGEASVLGGGAALRADVLQLPHHGSRTSSTRGFLAAVDPLVGIAASGERPRFAYPDPLVVMRVLAVPAVVVDQRGGFTAIGWRDPGRLVVAGEEPVFVPLPGRAHAF